MTEQPIEAAARDGVRLAGTLVLPVGGAPARAVVMLPGSGPMDRWNEGYFAPIRDHLVAQGIAVAGFDKRGIGGSGGSWLAAAPDVVVDDAMATVETLRRLPGLQSARVGVFGHSQGGWMAVMAAAREPGPDFAVSQSGPGTTLREQDRYAVGRGLRDAGAAADVIEACLAFSDRLADLVASGASWPEIEREVAVAREQSWWPTFVRGEPDPTEAFADFYRLWVDLDPAPAIRRLACPTLAVFGADDRVTPVEPSIRIFREEFPAGVRKGTATGSLDIEVVPDANHRLFVAAETFAPGYLDRLSDWILARR